MFFFFPINLFEKGQGGRDGDSGGREGGGHRGEGGGHRGTAECGAKPSGICL